MAAPLSTPARPVARGSVSGLFSLILLLLLVLAGTAAFTAYLLRTDVMHPVAVPVPAAYTVLYREGAQIWSQGPAGKPRSVLAPLPLVPEAVSVAPDGRRMVLIVAGSEADQALLVDGTGAAPRPLATPSRTLGAGPWRYVAAAWPGSHTLSLLFTSGAQRGVLGRYSTASAGVPVSWQRLSSGHGRFVSLSPSAHQLAVVDVRGAQGVFAAQAAVRLQRMDGRLASVALRYLGAQGPEGLFWSPDGGTLAIQVPGQGLTIQKSSGRPVREVAEGTMPVAFSERGATLAYLAREPGTWQIHVLNLHGEVDHAFPAPSSAAPTWVGWTPDARALLYAAGGMLWQIEPVAGSATRLPISATGDLIGAVPAGGPFGS